MFAFFSNIILVILIVDKTNFLKNIKKNTKFKNKIFVITLLVELIMRGSHTQKCPILHLHRRWCLQGTVSRDF